MLQASSPILIGHGIFILQSEGDRLRIWTNVLDFTITTILE